MNSQSSQSILLAIAVCQKTPYCIYAKCVCVCACVCIERARVFSQQGHTTRSNFEKKNRSYIDFKVAEI